MSDQHARGATHGSTARACLLANLRTRNLGNIALTQVMRRLLELQFGEDNVVPAHRAPHAVVELVVRSAPSSWAARVDRRVGRDRAEAPPVLSAALSPAGAESRTPSLTRRAGRWLAHTRPGLEARALKDRAAARAHYGRLAGCDEALWVPGGEISTLTHPRNRLLDMIYALDRGLCVGMANFSFEPSPQTLSVFRTFAARLAAVIVRDVQSIEPLTDAGVAAAAIRTCPDAVFMLGSPLIPDYVVTPKVRSETVGIVLHGAKSVDSASWARLIDELHRQGHPVQIISSHLEHDHKVIADVLGSVRTRSAVAVAPEFLDVQGYLDHLSGLRGVVTARFHTAVMGFVTGTPTVGVDTYGNKVRGGLTAAGLGSYAAPENEWVDYVLDALAGDPPSASTLGDIRTQILDTYAAAFPLTAQAGLS